MQLIGEKRKVFEREKAQQWERQPMAQSASVVSGILQKWRAYQIDLINAQIDIRRELALKEPVLASEEQLELLLSKIERSILMGYNQRAEKLREFAGGRQVSSAVLQAVAQAWERDDYSIIPDARNRLEQLKIEIRQGLHKPVANHMNIEINNSTVYQLNLGQILGDMNNAVTTLTQNGHTDIASALKGLIERIAASDDPALNKKDVLEHLAFISQEAALSATDRKQGLVRTALSHVQTAVQAAATLSQAWTTFGPIIEGFFKN